MQPQQQTTGITPVFLDPTIGGEPGPGWANLQGRSVAIFPTEVGTSKPFDANDIRKDAQGNIPTVWFDLYVLDGPALEYGAAPKANPPRPFNTHRTDVPQVFRGQMTSHVNMHRAISAAYGKGGFLMGVIGKSDVGNGPYQITKFDPADPRKAPAEKIITRIVNNEPNEDGSPVLAPPPVALGGQAPAAPRPQYAQIPPAAQPQFAPPAMPQFGAPPAPAYPHLPPAAPAAAPQPQFAPPMPQPQMPAQPPWAAPAAPQFAPPAPAPNGPPASAIAAGMTPEYWASLTPEQQAWYHQQQAPAPAAPNPW